MTAAGAPHERPAGQQTTPSLLTAADHVRAQQRRNVSLDRSVAGSGAVHSAAEGDPQSATPADQSPPSVSERPTTATDPFEQNPSSRVAQAAEPATDGSPGSAMPTDPQTAERPTDGASDTLTSPAATADAPTPP